jgi:Trp operon repressor
LEDGTEISYDFCVVATGESYNNHPWLNEILRASLDTSDSSPLAALKSDLKKSDRQAYSTFIKLSGMEGVDIRIVRDFASEHEDADLFKFACLVSGRKLDLDAIEALRTKSTKVAKFLDGSKASRENADDLFDSVAVLLRGSTRLWASRGQIRENLSDGVLRSRDWRLDQLKRESKSIEDAKSILVRSFFLGGIGI